MLYIPLEIGLLMFTFILISVRLGIVDVVIYRIVIEFLLGSI